MSEGDGDGGYVCTECGRQQPTDMKTCECGSASFRQLTERLTRRCTECGTLVTKGVDSCPECGFRSFESLDAGPTVGEVATGYDEWQCTNCGRSHQRNNPPCKRCGHSSFERVSIDAEEVNPADYVDGRPWYKPDRNTAALAVLAVLLVGVVGAGLLGVGPLAQTGPWTETLDGDVLSERVAGQVNAARDDAGVAPVSTNTSLATAAGERAAAVAAGTPGDTVGERVTVCEAEGVLLGPIDGNRAPPGDGDPTESEVASALVGAALEDESARGQLLAEGHERIGVGTATSDGDLYVVVAVC